MGKEGGRGRHVHMHIMLFQGDLGQLTHVLVVKWFEAGIFGSSSQKTGVATGASGRARVEYGTTDVWLYELRM